MSLELKVKTQGIFSSEVFNNINEKIYSESVTGTSNSSASNNDLNNRKVINDCIDLNIKNICDNLNDNDCYDKCCKDVSNVPDYNISGLNLSFRDIAKQLCEFKNELLSNDLTQDFLLSPYSKTGDYINNLDRLWARLANKVVNNTTGVTPGYGKRILFASNDGYVFIDVSTFIEGSKKWLNFSVIALNRYSNFKFIDNPKVPQYNNFINSNSETFNYENINYSNIINNGNTPGKIFSNIKCGSTSYPPTDINDLTPQSTKAISFQLLDIHTTRKEIIESVSNTYGYSSRYSDTTFTPNYYVATTLNGSDGYSIFIRLSYYLQ